MTLGQRLSPKILYVLFISLSFSHLLSHSLTHSHCFCTEYTTYDSHPSIHPLIHGLSARWCPMSPYFLARRVSRLLGWLWYFGLSAVLVSIAFPFAFHISVFFRSLFYTCHWISFVFLLYDRRIATHSIDPSITHILGEFPGFGLALVPEAEHRCA